MNILFTEHDTFVCKILYYFVKIYQIYSGRATFFILKILNYFKKFKILKSLREVKLYKIHLKFWNSNFKNRLKRTRR